MSLYVSIYIILDVGGPEIKNCSNYDVTNVCTPVNARKLGQLLLESNYDREKTNYLVQGFTNGFDLGYRGPLKIKIDSPNLKFTVGSKVELWNKVMSEVEAGRYAGPFNKIPFDNYIQSPIGLVPKDKGTKTRLIFHLSYPKGGSTSVNANTPEEFRQVKYKDFDEAVKLCLRIVDNPDCAAAKSDLSSAFRQLPLNRKFWRFLVMKAQNPVDNKWYYFFDKNLPFGAAASCKIFQAFSDALSHIIKFRTGEENVNYLDDFLFLAQLFSYCQWQINIFLQTCKEIGFPVSLDKTEGPTQTITFLGLLIDLVNKRVCLPLQKVEKAKSLIDRMVSKKKTTLRELQQLCGFLNFLNKAIIPGRTFTRRIYNLLSNCNLTVPHHHLQLNAEAKDDLRMWQQFLRLPQAYARPFYQFDNETTYTPEFFMTDASMIGGGGVCQNDWFIIEWDEDLMEQCKPSINFLELYVLTIAIYVWGERFSNIPIIIYCDNMSVVHMVNNGTSKNTRCMKLLRIITLHTLIHNITIHVKYINTKENVFADSLSRLEYKRFKSLVKSQNKKFSHRPTEIPELFHDMYQFL